MYIYIYIYIYIHNTYIYIHIHTYTLWRTLMRTEYFLFVHHSTSVLAKLSTWCFEHSGDINCSLLVNPSDTMSPGKDETRVCRYIYIYVYIQIYRYIVYIV